MADAVWIQARIDAKKALIVSIETAIAALVTGAQMYSLDTGQTRTSVTKANLASLKNTLRDLESELASLETQLVAAEGGSTGIYCRPAF